jgi:MYXO-CTERM domain-containing protein
MQNAKIGSLSLTLALVTALWSSAADAAPNNWPFDFDPQIAAAPAGIQSGLSDLDQNLPGLRDEELTAVQLGPVALYLFDNIANGLDRAVNAGPGIVPDRVRTPMMCATHEAFVYPPLLVASPSAGCVSVEEAVAAAYADLAKTCTEVEFPETYVFEHPPGHVDTAVVNSLESLIAVAGEALSHIDFPVGLLQSDFFDRLRPIISKIRYTTLETRLTLKEAALTDAQTNLADSSQCFEPSARAALETTTNDLLAELALARTQLETTYQTGLSQATADRNAARADCRAREDLPHPSLTDDERILLAHYIGGIYWRARGAGLLAYPPDPEQGLLRRLLYVGYAFQVLADLAGGAGAEGVGTNLLIDENWGWDEWWDMGTTPGSADKYSDLVGMTARGKRGVDLARPQIEGRGYDIRSLIGGAMMMGPCYYYAWELLAGFRLGESLQDPYMWFIEWPTSLGEFCAGAGLAEGLVRTLLWGTEMTPAECADPCANGGCPDAGVVVGDGGVAGDGSTDPPGEPGVDPGSAESGCSCKAGSGGGASGGVVLLLMLLLLAGLRRR